ncbi:hypothetical protein V6N11_009988 [Hibiscus sabdariffa]|uniref:Reverse transcriptase zinc-binding domain-containing protein n=1 Tax=Hibiscus sabdariffa TaxID=183260 RepID=A0ABR2PDA4_9ROSI
MLKRSSFSPDMEKYQYKIDLKLSRDNFVWSRIKFFLTNHEAQHLSNTDSDRCAVCGDESETSDHLFRSCTTDLVMSCKAQVHGMNSLHSLPMNGCGNFSDGDDCGVWIMGLSKSMLETEFSGVFESLRTCFP